MGFIAFAMSLWLNTNPSFFIHYPYNYLPFLVALSSVFLLFPNMILLLKPNDLFSSIPALPSIREFNHLTFEILHHSEFIKLKDYFHHTHHIYDHVVRVGYLSYFISKLLGLDYVSSARGGLLHDFFLYDWRVRKKGDEHHSLHGKEHPYIALNNANLYFSVNVKERDIITKHMYPKTKERPIYAESFIVSIMDKVSTIIEYGKRIMNKNHTSYKKAL